MYICVYNCYINNVFIKLILLTSCYQWRKQIYNVRRQMNLLLWLRLYAYGIFKTAIGRSKILCVEERELNVNVMCR